MTDPASGKKLDELHYMKTDKPRPLVLFEVAKAAVTGETLDGGEVRKLSEAELNRG